MRPCLVVAWLSLSACHAAAPAPAPAPAAPVKAAVPSDIDEARAHALIEALSAGSAEAAETHFDQRMRSGLPPAVLLSHWQSLLARNGELTSFRVVKRDHPMGKDRFTFELTFSQQALHLQIAFEPSTHEVIGLAFTKKPAATPPEHESDADVHQETLSVGPLALPASWVLPALASRPLPAALLVGGSGPNDRDESIADAKPFRDLAHGLAKRGIATLRWDKRAFAHPDLAPEPAKATVEDEVLTDAVAALRLLRHRPEVDQERVFVIGHSLGALLTPEIAQRGGGVAGLVLLAAPGRPLERIVLDQLETAQPGADFNGLERQVRALPNLPPAAPVLGMPAGYWRDVDRRDEVAIAVALGRPVLLLRGAMDRNVAVVDQEHWLTGLSNRVPVQSATLPGLDHLFLSVTDTGEQRHVAPAVIEAIAQFIRRP
ncbi:MAG TPA: alpha/beta hydrolase [Polyangiaceae bacterium]|nr:alpha/beta hydrolase [Polyangiaceae bacterium]